MVSLLFLFLNPLHMEKLTIDKQFFLIYLYTIFTSIKYNSFNCCTSERVKLGLVEQISRRGMVLIEFSNRNNKYKEMFL